MAGNGVVLGIGNPLLDISADVPKSFFEKYKATPGTACLAEEHHNGIFTDMQENFSVEYIAGGACQNSIRACQWMSSDGSVAYYVGCIGDDDNGKTLKTAAEKEGVTTHYHVDKETSTGTCACLINEKERCLIANLAAANCYKIDHLQSAEMQDVIKSTDVFYATGFFLTVCPDALISIGEHAVANNKPFMWNISAEFLVNFFWEPFQKVLPYADFLFGNETEATAFGKKNGWDVEDLGEVALKTAAWEKKNDKRSRVVVFTQGKDSTIVCQDGKVTRYDVPKVDPSTILDTNGAGDSFVGGFISMLRRGEPIERCVAAGHYCAGKVIQVSGASYVGKPDFS
eukprot:CAMPEP_0119118742 /NCGR_PEP_ID=MMETSP1310-20130426/518_1 /TAXON_ID=464262 /ORGANISM="Genus nov. species nov., Strain RCC2339" /LENGTH=341 /DNA_ID=CAMNT_0007108129 /DNA_START=52 /DNA_END=1077 /DNA_ORIENTATION=+